MKSANFDNSPKSSRRFGQLGGRLIQHPDRVSRRDREDLFSFSFTQQQLLNFQVQLNNRNGRLRVQLFALKQSKQSTFRAIGDRDFSSLSQREINNFFTPITTVRLNQRGSTLQRLGLNQGDYYIRASLVRGVANYRLTLLSESIPLPSLAASPTPTPTPISTPAPTPISTSTPAPTPNPVPNPAPVPVPAPIPTPAPIPVPTPNPIPTPNPTPSPLPTPNPNPNPTPTPNPTPIPTTPVNAGQDFTASLAIWGNTSLAGSVNVPGTFTVRWSQKSGAGVARFENRSDPRTRVKFSQPGTYVLQLSATNGVEEISDEVTITVNRPTIRIMPLGDSITQADSNHSSYRRPLWQMLQNNQYSVDFVGSVKQNFGGTNPNPDFDLDHEGYWGWRTDEILSKIDSWAGIHKPDVALIHLGTNDIFQGNSNASTINELEELISRLRAQKPDVAILLAQLIPYQGDTTKLTDLNQRIAILAARLNTVESPIILVDQNTGFNVDTDTYDGVHPNAAGEQKMANRWFNALERLFWDDSDPVKRGQIDQLTGTSGANTFVLGAWEMPYYDDGLIHTPGLNDYALIQNFEQGIDRIQLVGSASDYLLAASPINAITGTAIYRDTNSNGALDGQDELIGIVKNTTGLNLTNSNQFIYA